MNKRKIHIILVTILLLPPYLAFGQTDMTTYINEGGKLDKWHQVIVKESGVIGGKVTTLHKLDENGVWSLPNVTANIIGVIKTSNSVFPEKRGDGYCARLEIIQETVKVMGMLNLYVVAQGTLILGSVIEPIRDTKSPYSKLISGIPYTEKPKALQLDYKAKVGNKVVRGTGLSPRRDYEEIDYSDVLILLQYRWEEENGDVHSLRVGTGYKRITESSTEWKNGEQVEILYGDITGHNNYKEYMGMRNGEIANYTMNSYGKIVPIKEEGWAKDDVSPTHIIIWISASSGKAFYGGIGNTLWVDNVKLIF